MARDIDLLADYLLRCPVGCGFLLTIENHPASLDIVLEPGETFERACWAVEATSPWRAEHEWIIREVLARGALLRELARDVLSHPGSGWWSEPFNSARQVLLINEDNPRPRRRHGRRKNSWFETYAQRPDGNRLTSTLRGDFSSMDYAMSWGVGDWCEVEHSKRVRASIDPSARVYEVNSPEDWHRLCARWPSKDVHPNSPVPRTIAPDWGGLSSEYEGVHLSFLGLLTTPSVPITSKAGRSMMWSWEQEGTFWLDTPLLKGGVPLPDKPVDEHALRRRYFRVLRERFV